MAALSARAAHGDSVLAELVRMQKRGVARGIASVCSAHPLVLQAAFEQALQDGSSALLAYYDVAMLALLAVTDAIPAHLSDAPVNGANLRDANLSGAHLHKSRFRDANLSGANLSGAYL